MSGAPRPSSASAVPRSYSAGGSSNADAVAPAPYTAKLDKVQAKVDDAKIQVAANIELLIQRGEKLEDLDQQTLEFNERARDFRSGAKKVEAKQRWSKYKWYICCIVLALILCSGIIVAIVVAVKN